MSSQHRFLATLVALAGVLWVVGVVVLAPPALREPPVDPETYGLRVSSRSVSSFDECDLACEEMELQRITCLDDRLYTEGTMTELVSRWNKAASLPASASAPSASAASAAGSHGARTLSFSVASAPAAVSAAQMGSSDSSGPRLSPAAAAAAAARRARRGPDPVALALGVHEGADQGVAWATAGCLDREATARSRWARGMPEARGFVVRSRKLKRRLMMPRRSAVAIGLGTREHWRHWGRPHAHWINVPECAGSPMRSSIAWQASSPAKNVTLHCLCVDPSKWRQASPAGLGGVASAHGAARRCEGPTSSAGVSGAAAAKQGESELAQGQSAPSSDGPIEVWSAVCIFMGIGLALSLVCSPALSMIADVSRAAGYSFGRFSCGLCGADFHSIVCAQQARCRQRRARRAPQEEGAAREDHTSSHRSEPSEKACSEKASVEQLATVEVGAPMKRESQPASISRHSVRHGDGASSDGAARPPRILGAAVRVEGDVAGLPDAAAAAAANTLLADDRERDPETRVFAEENAQNLKQVGGADSVQRGDVSGRLSGGRLTDGQMPHNANVGAESVFTSSLGMGYYGLRSNAVSSWSHDFAAFTMRVATEAPRRSRGQDQKLRRRRWRQAGGGGASIRELRDWIFSWEFLQERMVALSGDPRLAALLLVSSGVLLPGYVAASLNPLFTDNAPIWSSQYWVFTGATTLTMFILGALCGSLLRSAHRVASSKATDRGSVDDNPRSSDSSTTTMTRGAGVPVPQASSTASSTGPSRFADDLDKERHALARLDAEGPREKAARIYEQKKLASDKSRELLAFAQAQLLAPGQRGLTRDPEEVNERINSYSGSSDETSLDGFLFTPFSFYGGRGAARLAAWTVGVLGLLGILAGFLGVLRLLGGAWSFFVGPLGLLAVGLVIGVARYIDRQEGLLRGRYALCYVQLVLAAAGFILLGVGALAAYVAAWLIVPNLWMVWSAGYRGQGLFSTLVVVVVQTILVFAWILVEDLKHPGLPSALWRLGRPETLRGDVLHDFEVALLTMALALAYVVAAVFGFFCSRRAAAIRDAGDLASADAGRYRRAFVELCCDGDQALAETVWGALVVQAGGGAASTSASAAPARRLEEIGRHWWPQLFGRRIEVAAAAEAAAGEVSALAPKEQRPPQFSAGESPGICGAASTVGDLGVDAGRLSKVRSRRRGTLASVMAVLGDSRVRGSAARDGTSSGAIVTSAGLSEHRVPDVCGGSLDFVRQLGELDEAYAEVMRSARNVARLQPRASRSLGDLFVQADLLNPIFQMKFASVADRCNGAAVKVQPGSRRQIGGAGCTSPAEAPSSSSSAVTHFVVPVKGEERAVEKLIRCYRLSHRRMVDLVRTMLVFDDVRSLTRCLRMLAADPEILIVRGEPAKNRFSLDFDATAKTGGYRDLQLTVMLRNPETVSRGVAAHMCEVQLNLKPFVMLKTDRGHANYVARRNLLGE